jgi:ribose transport system permease protein
MTRLAAPRTRRFTLPAYAPVTAATIVLFVAGGAAVPRSVSGISIQGVLPIAAVLAIAAVGQTLIIQQRGVDISAGGAISVAAMILGISTSQWAWNLGTAIVVSLASCVVIGLVNSILVARLNISPLITTLAMNSLLLGAVILITGASTSTTEPTGVYQAVTAKWLGVPAIAWIAIAFVAVAAFLMAKTVPGRKFVAAGASPAAARVSGVGIRRNLVFAYMFGGLTYGIAGVLLGGYLQYPGSTVGSTYTFLVIAAVVVGGTPLIGGRGTIIGSAIAALFLAQLDQLVLTIGATTSVQDLIQAGAIAAAAAFQGLSRVRRRSSKAGLEPEVRTAPEEPEVRTAPE